MPSSMLAIHTYIQIREVAFTSRGGHTRVVQDNLLLPFAELDRCKVPSSIPLRDEFADWHGSFTRSNETERIRK